MLDWRDLDLKLTAVELAADEEGRKPGAAPITLRRFKHTARGTRVGTGLLLDAIIAGRAQQHSLPV